MYTTRTQFEAPQPGEQSNFCLNPMYVFMNLLVRSETNFEFRVFFLLDWLPYQSEKKKSSLPYCFTYC